MGGPFGFAAQVTHIRVRKCRRCAGHQTGRVERKRVEFQNGSFNFTCSILDASLLTVCKSHPIAFFICVVVLSSYYNLEKGLTL